MNITVFDNITFFWYTLWTRAVSAACAYYECVLHVHAACDSCLCILRVRVRAACCAFILYVRAARAYFVFMLRVRAVCSCWLCVLHVRTVLTTAAQVYAVCLHAVCRRDRASFLRLLKVEATRDTTVYLHWLLQISSQISCICTMFTAALLRIYFYMVVNILQIF